MFGFHKHCYHAVQGTERRIKPFSKCKKIKTYVSEGDYIKVIRIEECCICGKTRISPIYRNYSTDEHGLLMGLRYPSIEEKPLELI